MADENKVPLSILEEIKANEKVPPSVPEPAPTEGKVEVFPQLLMLLKEIEEKSTNVTEAKELLFQRYNFGKTKYKTVLKSHNSRNPIKDFGDEIGDSMQYLTQAMLEKRPEEDFDRIGHLLEVQFELYMLALDKLGYRKTASS